MVQWRRLGCVLTKEAWPVWVLFGGLVAAWGLSYVVASCPEDHIIYAGTILQLAGMYTVAKGIEELRHRFNRRTFREGVRAWLLQVKEAVNPTVQSGRFDMPSMTCCATLNVPNITTSPKMTLEMRVDALEKALAHVRQENQTHLSELRGDLGRVEVLVKEEGGHRQRGDAELLQTIEEVAVGGIRIELIGLVWLTLGMVGTSIPKAIAAWLPAGLIL